MPARRPHAGETGFWQRLAYRWFVEFNPLYLLSAALVLGGCFLLSRGLVSEENLVASLGIALVGEVYAVALLGGAALLVRIGRTRPAVLLTLLSLLYQWDLTLHTETCAYLGAAGTWAAAAWLAIFVGKIYALAWALRVRIAGRAIAAAMLGAAGLAVGPHVLPHVGERDAGAIVAVWVFALGALHSRGAIESRVALTAWAATVLRRMTRAAWTISGVLLAAHVLVLASDHAIALPAVLPVVPLLWIRGIRSEVRAWLLVLSTVAVAAVVIPGELSVTACLAAGALCLRVLSPTFRAASAPGPARAVAAPPYRATGERAPAPRAEQSIPGCAVVGAPERARAFVGAIFAVYVSAWTLHWSGGAWPAHVLALDAALTALVLLAMWRLHVRSPLAPLAACYSHLVIVTHLVSLPRTSTQWGASAIALGFLLLGGSLATSYRLRAHPLAQAAPRA